MKRVLVGHRGVGKSALLLRHYNYFPETPAFDLDHEIEKTTGKKIAEIFLTGESEFRRVEVEVFDQLIQKENFVIAVGGGFPMEKILSHIEVVFVSRITDADGRIFLNRPLINQNLSPLADSLQLYQQRQHKFLERADIIYHMPEGIRENDQIERNILATEGLNSGMYLTVVKNNTFEQRFFEIEMRTDLKIFSSNKRVLFSFRNKVGKINQFAQYDWALELGQPLSEVDVISIHEGTLYEGIDKLSKYKNNQLKLCPVINSWDELIQGYRWQQEDPQKRSFLPRSNYKWFRLLMSQRQKINFVRGFTDMNDQPSLYEVLDFKSKNKKEFGAVLGNPIHHSRTPWEQGSKMDYPVLAIPLEEKDYHIALPFLTELGLKFAAVTSPLKKIAGGNSIVFQNNEWKATSTDHLGFRELRKKIPAGSIAVWGGGGVMEALQKEIPDLKRYSAREGDGEPTDILIWAAPRNKDIKFPSWKPKLVIDLNYVENSMGLEYAQKYGIPYVSGLEMFIEQARHQQKFWKDHL